MSTTAKNRRVWEKIRQFAASHPDPRGFEISRGRLPHPRDAGARLTATWPVGQVADYAIDGAPGEPPLAIREYADRWEVFIDSAQVMSQALEAVEQEPSKAPYVAAMGAAMLGGAIGASVTNKRSGVLLGAGIGLLFAALLTAAIDEPDATPKRKRIGGRKKPIA